MNEQLVRHLMILNRNGLWSIPAARLVKTLRAYGDDTNITFAHEDNAASARSVMGLLTLGAEQGAVITVKVCGAQARVMLEAITELVNKGFSCGEPCLPVPPSHSEFIELSTNVEDGGVA